MALQPGKRTLAFFLLVVLITSSALTLVGFLYVASAPTTHTDGVNLVVARGMSVQEIAEEAKERGIVRSSLLLSTILTKSYDPTKIFAGTYRFEKPLSVFEVAEKLASICSALLKYCLG